MANKLYTILKNDGTFYSAFFETGEQPINAFDELYTGNYIKPKANKVNGVLEFYESATQEEQQINYAIKKEEYRSLIYATVESLSVSAKARALGKSGQNLNAKQLGDLEIFYTEKKKVAEEKLNGNNVTNSLLLELIEFEVEEDFSGALLDQAIDYLNSEYSAGIDINLDRLTKFCLLIVTKYGLGKQLDVTLKALIEYFRSKLITHLDKGDFHKVDAGILIAKTITNDMNINDILALKNDFDNL